MDQKIRAFLAEKALDIPVPRRAVECGAFSDLFWPLHFNSGRGYSRLGHVFAMHYTLLNETAEKHRDLQLSFQQDERVEIILMSLAAAARAENTTTFRLLTGATPEQEASFRFHDRHDLGLDFADYVWAVNVGVTPEEMFGVVQAPGMARGILRASQGRVNDKVRLRHVQHVLYMGSGRRNTTVSEGYSSSIGELAAAYQEGVLSDDVFRTLLGASLDRDQFAAAVAAVRAHVNIEYALAV